MPTSRRPTKGILDKEKKVVTCPWHGWKYSIVDGKSPHKGGDSVNSYETKVIKDKLYVNSIPANIGSSWNSINFRLEELTFFYLYLPCQISRSFFFS
ncbi:MAG: Rieske (2Fe-2S) protein [Nitrososphaeraceae archaeon]